MKIAYFDLITGASGDMILGALIDAGLPKQNLLDRLTALNIDDYKLQVRQVLKNGFRATKVDVIVKEHVPDRYLPDIEAMITKSELTEAIQQKAVGIFQRLGAVEAKIHGVSSNDVHLHELGGVDTIVDVVGTLLGLEELGIHKVFASPIPLGRGFVNAAHGQIPLPAPATLALLEGLPVVGSNLGVETVTPTGAVLLTSLSEKFGTIPPMKLQSTGYGAGGRDLPIPNLLRILIGEQCEDQEINSEMLSILETNIDDLNPEIYAYVMEKLFAAGALDVFITPIQMKKNRPGTQFSVICNAEDTSKACQIIFSETTTLGIRQHSILRHSLKRETYVVDTQYGMVQIKKALLPNGQYKISPEYEDCRKLAIESGAPLKDIYLAAEAAANLDR